MLSRKIMAPLLTLLLAVGVGAAIYLSATEQLHQRALVEVRGVSGSEKLPFFQDPETIKLLEAAPHRLVTRVEKAGSREIATRYDLAPYDFAFPAGSPAAEKIRRERGVTTAFQVFFTPMVIASWKPVAEVLTANGIVQVRDGIHYVVDMRKLLELIRQQKRWTDLEEHRAYPANKNILVTTTDIRQSNSAAMFLALASYVYNGDRIVQDADQMDQVVGPLGELFLRQGYIEHSSALPFQDYLVMGAGKTPLVMIYEAQFLHEKAKPDSAVTSDMVLLYPQPTLFTKHVLIPLTESGKALGEALTTDEALQHVAARHGLRTSNIALFNAFVREQGLAVPASLVDVIEPPSYEVLEGLIQRIESRYNALQ
ncbi:MAG: hypothetical protein H7831_07700 [Magnetococcus sp. WYHC-3]